MRNARLERAAQRVLDSSSTQFGIEVTFITPNGSVKGRRVLEFYSTADFVSKFTTDFDILTMVSLVDYRYKIYPNRDNLKALVQWFPIDASSNKYTSPKPLYADTYRALLFDNDDGATAAASALSAKQETNSLDEERVIKVALVEIASESLSYKNAQGTFRYTDNQNIVEGFISSQIKQEAQLNPAANVKLEMYPIDEVVEKRDAVTIPIKTRLVDVPEFMQTKEGGLYSNGLGSFIQRDTWWIYPVFDTSRFTKTTRRLKIIQMAGPYAPMAEQSWLYENGELTVVCTTASKMQDISTSAQINNGTGTRFIKASEMFNNTTGGDPNKEHFNSEGILAEFQVGKRDDGNNIAMFSDVAITDNIVNEYSKIAFRKGQIFITIWQRSMARYVYPGMPMRLYYDKDGQTMVYDGVVMQIDEQWKGESKGMIQKNMIATAAIYCFINKEVTRNG
ncbi:hypothetical protein ITP31_003952 [Salmonella enterica]|nr:hypothetical protein [Salmonella enterica]